MNQNIPYQQQFPPSDFQGSKNKKVLTLRVLNYYNFPAIIGSQANEFRMTVSHI